jgi:hypothetical protein
MRKRSQPRLDVLFHLVPSNQVTNLLKRLHDQLSRHLGGGLLFEFRDGLKKDLCDRLAELGLIRGIGVYHILHQVLR